MNSRILIGEVDQIIQKATVILELEKLKKGHPDVLWMEEEKLGVEQAKMIREFLSLKPYSASGRVVVVLNFQNMTPDGQNSLLKTLEEPPEKATILLGAGSDKKILPTILSRCEVISINEYGITNNEKFKAEDIEKLLKMSIEERFEYIEKIEDKDSFFNALVAYFHHQLGIRPSLIVNRFATELLHAEQWREANGNIRAILEYLMLKMPSG